jgi:hypothetical protein
VLKKVPGLQKTATGRYVQAEDHPRAAAEEEANAQRAAGGGAAATGSETEGAWTMGETSGVETSAAEEEWAAPASSSSAEAAAAYATTPVIEAVKVADVAALQLVMAQHPDLLDVVDGEGYTPIHHAVYLENADTLGALMAAKVRPSPLLVVVGGCA